MHELAARYAKMVGPENLATRKRKTLTHRLILSMLTVPENTVISMRCARYALGYGGGGG